MPQLGLWMEQIFEGGRKTETFKYIYVILFLMKIYPHKIYLMYRGLK